MVLEGFFFDILLIIIIALVASAVVEFDSYINTERATFVEFVVDILLRMFAGITAGLIIHGKFDNVYYTAAASIFGSYVGVKIFDSLSKLSKLIKKMED